MDEAGTGAWVGPITVGVAATPFICPFYYQEVKDSKQLSVDDREWLFNMMQEGVAWAVGMASQQEIDDLGQARAKRLCAQRALRTLFYKYPYHPLQRFREVVIDGNNAWGLGDANDVHNARWLGRLRPVVRADDTVWEVSAASVCAKVVRDRWMREVASDFSDYGFDSNVGYGTPEHAEALERLGPCVLHRRSVRPVRDWLAAHEDFTFC